MASANKEDVPVRGECEVQDKAYGCTGRGKRIENPYVQEIDGEQEWILACPRCEDSLVDAI